MKLLCWSCARGSGARGRTASKSSLVVHARTIRVALGAYLLQIELLGETLRLLVEQGTNNDSNNTKGSSKKKLNLKTIVVHKIIRYLSLIVIGSVFTFFFKKWTSDYLLSWLVNGTFKSQKLTLSTCKTLNSISNLDFSILKSFWAQNTSSTVW